MCCARIVMSLLLAGAAAAQQYTISTIAGGGPPPSPVPALSVRVLISAGIAISSAGDVYFSSENAVLKVDAKGILTRVAGTGRYGYSGDGGPALRAQLAWPAGLALDGAGNLFIADNANHRIRKVSPDGIITTVAGSGTAGNSGDDGPAARAQLNWPTGVAVDSSGNLYIADAANGRIRRVSSDGIMTTVVSGLHHAEGVAADASGNLYVADYEVVWLCGDCDVPIGRILRVTASGTTETLAEGGGLGSLRGIALDEAGNLYAADGASVQKISPSGVITTAVGNRSFFAGPAGVAVDSSGNLYVSDPSYPRIAKLSPQGELANLVGDGIRGNYWGDGRQAAEAALNTPLGVAVDKAGNLYISDTGNSRVRKVSPDGVITTVAGNGIPGYSGDGGPATSAQLRGPSGLAVDASGATCILRIASTTASARSPRMESSPRSPAGEISIPRWAMGDRPLSPHWLGRSALRSMPAGICI